MISLAGEFDLTSSSAVGDEILRLSESNEPKILVDLSGVSFIDSSALGALVSCTKHVREHQGEIEIVAPPGSPLHRLLELTGLDETIRPYAAVDDIVDG